MEIWKPIPGYEGKYDVSSLGRVRSLMWQGRARAVPFILAQTDNGYGYRVVHLYLKGHKINLVHRLVMSAFVGPCPEGMEVLHKDHVRHHNRLSNLRYGTHRENEEEKIRDGRTLKGSKHGMSKLSEDQVLEIFDMAEMGYNDEFIAQRMPVSMSTIWGIRKGRAWKHV